MHKQVSVQLTSNSKFLSKFSRNPLSRISDQKALPSNRKLQIWDDQSLLRNNPPPMENFRFELTKVYSEIPPSQNGKLQILDDQSLLRNTPPSPKWKTSDLRWPKFTPKYPTQNGKLQIWDDQSLLRNTPLPKSCWWECPYVETYIYHTDNILISWVRKAYCSGPHCLLSTI